MSLPELAGLRSWQAEAITKYLELNQVDFTVTATPGAGKTTFALSLARHLLETRFVDRVIVVVPTDHLRTQWGQAAARMGIRLDSNLGNDAILKKDFHGYVTTYPQVAAHSLLHERRTENPRRTFVILDEIHHAGDGLSWGDAIKHAFAPAVRRLALTGTPFRTSASERIPFVRYEEDGKELRSVADYSYGYKEALDGSVVRPVIFAAYSGVARWSSSAGEMAASLTEDLTKDQEFQAWKTILDPKGQWVPHVLAAAASRLEEIRQAGMHDAGMLVLASDQESAKAYAKVLKTVTGVTPVVALSEDPKASSKISAFANGIDKYLVAVRMVSEGVDVPRLGVLVWLTSYRTPLFFAQAVGRVVRARRTGESATVFLPAVRPLLALAAEMEIARDHVLAHKPPKNEDEVLLANANREQTELSEVDEFRALNSQAQFAHVLFSGKALTGEPVSGNMGELFGLPQLLSPEQTAAMLSQRDDKLRRRAEVAAGSGDAQNQLHQEALSEKMSSLRKEISVLVNRLSTRWVKPHSEIHIMSRKMVPGPSNSEASLDILQRRRDWLLGKLY